MRLILLISLTLLAEARVDEPSVDLRRVPSPNKQWVAFLEPVENFYQVFISKKGVKNKKQLTYLFAGFGIEYKRDGGTRLMEFTIHHFSWSPDSQWIAFDWGGMNLAKTTWEIHGRFGVIDLKTGNIWVAKPVGCRPRLLKTKAGLALDYAHRKKSKRPAAVQEDEFTILYWHRLPFSHEHLKRDWIQLPHKKWVEIGSVLEIDEDGLALGTKTPKGYNHPTAR